MAPHGRVVAKSCRGVRGTCCEVMRPDGKPQVTYSGLARYTFNGDSPTKILCNGVDGWFVVKAH